MLRWPRLPTALLATFNAAENVPAVVDAKVTVMEQFAPIRDVPQVFPVTVKSLWLVPLIETPLGRPADEPVFVKVAVCA